MANHKSAIKRIRANKAKRTLNRYQHKTVRTALKSLNNEKDKKKVEEQLPSLFSMIDKF